MDDEIHSSSSFQQSYRCYSISFSTKSHLESGDKIILPESALLRLSRMEIQYPMMFQLRNPKTDRVSHCGVAEFSSDEGEILLPDWMMNNMGFEQGGLAMIKNVNLVKGNYIKLQPHATDFIRLSDPKAVLERTLRGFSCLSAGDTIMIMYEGKKFYIDVLETKPEAAISIIETDCEVDFAPPLDYKEPEEKKPAAKNIEKVVVADDEEPKFRPFTGLAKRLDGSPVSTSVSAAEECRQSSVGRKRKVVIGSSNVGKPSEVESRKEDKKGRTMEKNKEEKGFQAFTGKSYRLAE
ncbi:uncharacterized protein LOC107416396 [Ziziphus jujuba]|uniref:Uncharacterized protein LOC107416396 n=2 Tax=Ziziphus jujuba TaxID=326968 RepID=A0ABM3II10_ZIZJJ|nr:uncharacterized protein LOC107416396 [Ziziphus jujuba]KAH7533827.1 hypothetical protein FEM48_Zijuj04G0173000 [Ziziphus jujuba var. spinosa]